MVRLLFESSHVVNNAICPINQEIYIMKKESKFNSGNIQLFEMNKEMSFSSLFKQIFSKKGIQLIFQNFWDTSQSNFKRIIKIISAFAIFLFIILVIAVKSGIEPSDLTRDQNGVLHFEPYVGMLSSLGIFMWYVALVLCWFAWYFIRMNNPNSGRKNFFLVSGFITSIIAVDDLFQFHETILPDYLGLPEISFYIVYFIALFIFNIKYINALMNPHFSLLMNSYFFLAASIIFDVFFERTVPFGTYIEDGLKFIGIAFWSTFFFKTVLLELNGLIKRV